MQPQTVICTGTGRGMGGWIRDGRRRGMRRRWRRWARCGVSPGFSVPQADAMIPGCPFLSPSPPPSLPAVHRSRRLVTSSATRTRLQPCRPTSSRRYDSLSDDSSTVCPAHLVRSLSQLLHPSCDPPILLPHPSHGSPIAKPWDDGFGSAGCPEVHVPELKIV